MQSLNTDATLNVHVEEQWSRVIGAESLLASWLGGSLLLLGNALLFFHMVAASGSLGIDRSIAGIIATGFVVVSVMVLLPAAHSYRLRSRKAVANLPTSLQTTESRVKTWNNIISTLLCVLFVFVGAVIVHGSVAALS